MHAGHAIGGNIPGHAQILWLPPTCPFKTPMCAKHKYLAQLKTQPSLIASKAESERCVCERSSHSITSAMILCHNQTTHLTKISKNNLLHHHGTKARDDQRQQNSSFYEFSSPSHRRVTYSCLTIGKASASKAKQSICQLKHISAPGSPMPLFLKLCREQNGDVGKS